nr:MAG TPA: hypothetical protein [Caudoviricetes sp.]
MRLLLSKGHYYQRQLVRRMRGVMISYPPHFLV